MADPDAERRRQEEQRRAEVLALPVRAVRGHGTLAGDPGDVLVNASVGPSGEAIALWAAADDLHAVNAVTVQPGWATFPDPRASRPVPARITVHGSGGNTRFTIADQPLAHPSVQPLPGDRLLVVGARCRWRPEGPDRNAIVYDADGRIVVERTVGDGIEHVLTSRSGHVWIGYFDEGVMGNYGWGDPDTPEPLGAAGLVRFTPELEADWWYPAGVGRSLGFFLDCYALNVDADTVWACYHTDFPVVRVDGDVVTGWHNTLARGVKALATSGTTVALHGGYGPDFDRLVVAAFGADALHKLAEYRVVLPDGSPMPTHAHIVGRGADIHVIHGNAWYRLDLDDLAG